MLNSNFVISMWALLCFDYLLWALIRLRIITYVLQSASACVVPGFADFISLSCWKLYFFIQGYKMLLF